MVDKVRRYTPRPRQAAQEAIEAYIIRNQMKGNDKFPPERTMCQMWGLNRSTLRSTLARMVSDGRVHAVQGSGTCFTPRVDRVLQDLKSFTQYAADLGMKPETRLLGLSMVECDKQLGTALSACAGRKAVPCHPPSDAGRDPAHDRDRLYPRRADPGAGGAGFGRRVPLCRHGGELSPDHAPRL